ncbi:MAG: DUF4215 domain-containing protein, partial [Myxococcales bacterium]|nr:DUF4215 domain-containing protein [Myxococcales bacterium]
MSVGGRGIAFDSANPTGGDNDLGTPNQAFGGPGVGAGGASTNMKALGNLLISAENVVDQNHDGLVDSPDDDAGGALLVFTFDRPMCLIDVDLVDVESNEAPASFSSFDGDGNLIGTVEALGLGDNSYQSLVLNVCGVKTLKVRLLGSGGMDNLRLCPDGECGDGNLDAGEQCDDGNVVDNDGCSATCQVEVGGGCGDGVLDLINLEECDDGN